MAQVRAVRRPYTSDKRGRVNDAAHADRGASTGVDRGITPQAPRTQAPQAPPGVTTVTLPPLEDEPGPGALPEASDEEREAPGTGEEMEGIEAVPDGTEHVLESTPDEPGEPAATAEAASEAPVESNVDYSTWTVSRLAAELRKRELPSSGAKPELVARLLESDVDSGV